MNKFIINISRSLGLLIVILGVLIIEKYLDTMDMTQYSLKPLLFIFFGLMIYFYNRD